MIKSRAQLKKAFENGAMPDGADFANLIDSTAAETEYAAFVAATNAALAQRNCELGDFPQAQQWMGLGGRIGLYVPGSPGAGKMPAAASLTTLSVPADGKWHPIVPNLNGCFGFEVVASAAGAPKSNNNALTHAIALTSVSGGPWSIRQTRTWSGWLFCRRISLCWKKSGDSWSLNIKTGRDFGSGADGKPVLIQYHISRLW